MNRRSLLKSFGAVGAIALLPVTLPIAGCAFSVKGMLNVLISAVESILKVATGATWVTELTNALTALQQAEASWTTGGVVNIVIDALNTVEAVLAVIPTTAVFSPLIDVIVAGIEAILNYFNPSPASLAKPRATARTNPYVGVVKLNRTSFTHPTYQGAFKAQFNDAAEAVGLPQAKIA